MAVKTSNSESLIILSSSDEEVEDKNEDLKKKTMNCLGLENSTSVTKSSTEDSAAQPSTSSSNSTVNGGSANEATIPESSVLIEKFVSTLHTVLKNGEDVKIINKVYELKSKCQPKYLNSEEFKNRMTSAIEKIFKDQKNVFVYIKEVYDEMKAYKMRKQEADGETEPSTSSLPSEEQANERHIRTLEKLLGKLDRKIRRLKTKEISLEELDSNYSAYIYEDKLSKRFVKVWEKLCELKKRSAKLKSHTNRKFHYSATRYPEVNSEIEKFVNSSRRMPDYGDILKVTRTTSENSSLGMSESAIQLLAQEIFKDVCRELQHRRVCDFKELSGCYLTDDVDVNQDPAESDSALKEKLEESYKEGQLKEENLLKEFTAKQEAMKLEPEEVLDEAVAEDTLDRCEDPDDEEEDRLIESQQKEDEEYSDDEKIKRFLDDPDANVDNSKSPFSSSEDEQEPDSISVIETCEETIHKEHDTENPSSAAKQDRESDSSSGSTTRSCLARLKVTPLKSALSEKQDESVEDEPCDLPDVDVAILTPPPPKRFCSESNSKSAFDQDVIVLD